MLTYLSRFIALSVITTLMTASYSIERMGKDEYMASHEILETDPALNLRHQSDCCIRGFRTIDEGYLSNIGSGTLILDPETQLKYVITAAHVVSNLAFGFAVFELPNNGGKKCFQIHKTFSLKADIKEKGTMDDTPTIEQEAHRYYNRTHDLAFIFLTAYPENVIPATLASSLSLESKPFTSAGYGTAEFQDDNDGNSSVFNLKSLTIIPEIQETPIDFALPENVNSLTQKSQALYRTLSYNASLNYTNEGSSGSTIRDSNGQVIAVTLTKNIQFAYYSTLDTILGSFLSKTASLWSPQWHQYIPKNLFESMASLIIRFTISNQVATIIESNYLDASHFNCEKAFEDLDSKKLFKTYQGPNIPGSFDVYNSIINIQIWKEKIREVLNYVNGRSSEEPQIEGISYKKLWIDSPIARLYINKTENETA